MEVQWLFALELSNPRSSGLVRESTPWQQIHHTATPSSLAAEMPVSISLLVQTASLFFLLLLLLVLPTWATSSTSSHVWRGPCNAITSLSDSWPLPNPHCKLWWLWLSVTYFKHKILAGLDFQRLILSQHIGFKLCFAETPCFYRDLHFTS